MNELLDYAGADGLIPETQSLSYLQQKAIKKARRRYEEKEFREFVMAVVGNAIKWRGWDETSNSLWMLQCETTQVHIYHKVLVIHITVISPPVCEDRRVLFENQF